MNSSFVTSPSSSALSDSLWTSSWSTAIPCSLKWDNIFYLRLALYIFITFSSTYLFIGSLIYNSVQGMLWKIYFVCMTYLKIRTYSATDIFPFPFLSAMSNNSAMAFVCLRSFKLFPTIKAAIICDNIFFNSSLWISKFVG